MERLLRKQTNVYFDDTVYTNEDYTVDDKECIVVSSADRQFYLYVDKKIDTSAQKAQLEKDLAYQKGFLTAITKKLSNERFMQNAKPEVVALERKKLADAEAKIKAIEESLARMD
jgi:valyl-tRNA synthetase